MHGHKNLKRDYVKTSPRPRTDQLHNNNASDTIPLIFHQYEDFLTFVHDHKMTWFGCHLSVSFSVNEHHAIDPSTTAYFSPL